MVFNNCTDAHIRNHTIQQDAYTAKYRSGMERQSASNFDKCEQRHPDSAAADDKRRTNACDRKHACIFTVNGERRTAQTRRNTGGAAACEQRARQARIFSKILTYCRADCDNIADMFNTRNDRHGCDCDDVARNIRNSSAA